MFVRIITARINKSMLIALLVCMGMAAMAVRWFYFDESLVLAEDTAWKVSLAGRFDVSKDSTILHSAKPRPGRYIKLISQRLYHPGFKILPSKQSAPGVLRARATLSGTTQFIVDYHIQLNQIPALQLNNLPALTTLQREKYLRSEVNVDLSLPDLSNLSEYLQRNTHSKPELIHEIFQHCQKLIKQSHIRYDDLKNTIKHNKATTMGRAKLMVALIRINSIPARVVTGFILEESTLNKPYYWVEVFDEKNQWQAYDPEKGYEGTIPNNYVAFGYDTPDLFTIENGKLLSTRYSLSEDLDILNVALIAQEKNVFDIFNLQRLDFETRQSLTLLLILPFCVLFTAFIRHVIGFFPYGTFTAPLLALAMVYAEISITLVLAGIIIFLALLGRAILPKHMLRAPRLSLIFTFVAMSMVLSVSIMTYFSMNPGGSIVLLPTIILVAIVDRFYSYMDEVNAKAALIRLGVTVLIALACIPILTFENLKIFVLNYPEIHFITAAFVFVFSSYKGKKLTDYSYLQLLGENKNEKRKKPRLKSVGENSEESDA